MNKKFLSIFALVALLVAAMAGAAFAGNPPTISELARIGDGSDGLSPITAAGPDTATLRFYVPLITDAGKALTLTINTLAGDKTKTVDGLDVTSYAFKSFAKDAKIVAATFEPSDFKVDSDNAKGFSIPSIATFKIPDGYKNADELEIGFTTKASVAAYADCEGQLKITATALVDAALGSTPDATTKTPLEAPGEVYAVQLTNFDEAAGKYLLGDFSYAVTLGGVAVDAPFDVEITPAGLVTFTAKDSSIMEKAQAGNYEVTITTVDPIKYLDVYEVTELNPDGKVVTTTVLNSAKIKLTPIVVAVAPKRTSVKFTPNGKGLLKDGDVTYFMLNEEVDVVVSVDWSETTGAPADLATVTTLPVTVSNLAVKAVDGKPAFTIKGKPSVVSEQGKPLTVTLDNATTIFGVFPFEVRQTELAIDGKTDATVGELYEQKFTLSIKGPQPAPAITAFSVLPADTEIVVAETTENSFTLAGTPTKSGDFTFPVTAQYAFEGSAPVTILGEVLVKVADGVVADYELELSESEFTANVGQEISEDLTLTAKDSTGLAVDLSVFHEIKAESDAEWLKAAYVSVDEALKLEGTPAAADAGAVATVTVTAAYLNAAGDDAEVKTTATVTVVGDRYEIRFNKSDIPATVGQEIDEEVAVVLFDTIDEIEVEFDTIGFELGEPTAADADWLDFFVDGKSIDVMADAADVVEGEYVVTVPGTYTDGDSEKTITSTFKVKVTAPVTDFGLKFTTDFDAEAIVGDILDEVVSLDLVLPDGYVGDAAFGAIASFVVDGDDAVGLAVDLIDGEYAFGITGTATEVGTVTVDVVVSLDNAPKDSVSGTYTFKVDAFIPPTPITAVVEAEVDPTDVQDLADLDVNLLQGLDLSDKVSYHTTGLTSADLDARDMMASPFVKYPAAEGEAIALELLVNDMLLDAIEKAFEADGDDAIIQALTDNRVEVWYDFVNVNGVSTGEKVKLIGSGGKLSWKQAFDAEIAYFTTDGFKIRYILCNDEADTVEDRVVVFRKFFVIADGIADGFIADPMIVTERNAHSSGSSGCDAGFGAFALLGLAGLALLRKKD